MWNNFNGQEFPEKLEKKLAIHIIHLILQKELDGFLDYTRMKFVGFKLQDDRTTLAGMPKPIHEGVRILNNYIYKSLGEVSLYYACYRYCLYLLVNLGKHKAHCCQALN